MLGGMQEHRNPQWGYLMGFLTRNSGQSIVRKGEGDFDGGEQCSGLKLFSFTEMDMVSLGQDTYM